MKVHRYQEKKARLGQLSYIPDRDICFGLIGDIFRFTEDSEVIANAKRECGYAGSKANPHTREFELPDEKVVERAISAERILNDAKSKFNDSSDPLVRLFHR